MTDHALHCWVDEHIVPLVKSDDLSEEDMQVYITELFQHIVLSIGDRTETDTERSSKKMIMFDDIKYMDSLWCEAMRYMTYQYNIPLTRYGFIILIKMMKFSSDEITEAVHNQVDRYVEFLDAKISHEYDPNNNPGTLKEYFTLLKEIETYYQDMSRYDSDQLKEKAVRLTEIFNHLMRPDSSKEGTV